MYAPVTQILLLRIDSTELGPTAYVSRAHTSVQWHWFINFKPPQFQLDCTFIISSIVLIYATVYVTSLNKLTCSLPARPPQTWSITIHYTAKLSAQCNYLVTNYELHCVYNLITSYRVLMLIYYMFELRCTTLSTTKLLTRYESYIDACAIVITSTDCQSTKCSAILYISADLGNRRMPV